MKCDKCKRVPYLKEKNDETGIHLIQCGCGERKARDRFVLKHQIIEKPEKPKKK